MERQQKLQALATYLGVEPTYFEENEVYDPNEFESKEYSESYVVLTEEEAYDYAKRDIENLFDDLGLESFTPSFKDWIISNAIDTSYFEDIHNESNQAYVDDIEYEDDEVYENRLISELVDEGILTEEDFINWGEDHPTLNPDVDLDDKKREYVEKLSNTDDYVQDYIDNYGDKALKRVFDENPSIIDLDVVVDKCIEEDGLAHFIARYDGEEHDLGNGLYAYRVN